MGNKEQQTEPPKKKGGVIKGLAKAFDASAEWAAQRGQPQPVYAHSKKPAIPGRCGGCGSKRLQKGAKHCGKPSCSKYAFFGE